jgi:hypothetical protein
MTEAISFRPQRQTRRSKMGLKTLFRGVISPQLAIFDFTPLGESDIKRFPFMHLISAARRIIRKL